MVGLGPFGVGIVPPPPGVPLSSAAPAIHPVVEPVTLQVGSFTTTIPPGSFKKLREGHEHEHEDGLFTFKGSSTACG